MDKVKAYRSDELNAITLGIPCKYGSVDDAKQRALDLPDDMRTGLQSLLSKITHVPNCGLWVFFSPSVQFIGIPLNMIGEIWYLRDSKFTCHYYVSDFPYELYAADPDFSMV